METGGGVLTVTTLADVLVQIPQIEITDQSRPTEAAVNDWIADIEATLNATLANLPPKQWQNTPGCRTVLVMPVNPVVSPLTAAIVVDLVVHAVVARVLQARLFGIGDVSGSGAKEAQAYYDERVAWLMDPTHPFMLPDVVTAVDCDDAGRSWFTGIRGAMGGGYRPQPTMRTRF